MKAALCAGALAVTVLLAVGCSTGGSSAALSGVPPIQFVPRSAAPLPTASERQPEVDEPEDGASRCSAGVQSAVDAVVSEQLAAFKARDFEAAFALASEQFRAITSPDGLRDLILNGHPEVADAVSHDFSDCRQANPDLVLGAVSVTGKNGKTVLLVYQFTMEDGTWHILQSAPMDGHGGSGSSAGTSAFGDV